MLSHTVCPLPKHMMRPSTPSFSPTRTHTKQRETTLWVRFRVTADLWIADSFFHWYFSNVLSDRLIRLGRHTALGRTRKVDLAATWAVVFHNAPTDRPEREAGLWNRLWVSVFHVKLTAEWQLNRGRDEKRGREKKKSRFYLNGQTTNSSQGIHVVTWLMSLKREMTMWLTRETKVKTEHQENVDSLLSGDRSSTDKNTTCQLSS